MSTQQQQQCISERTKVLAGIRTLTKRCSNTPCALPLGSCLPFGRSSYEDRLLIATSHIKSVHTHLPQTRTMRITPRVIFLGLAKTIHKWCSIYSIFGRKVTKVTFIYGAYIYIRFWPALVIYYATYSPSLLILVDD